ncbi:MAG: UDP-forming cellulose synthase catalytic subunit [Methylococcales bacterium]|nr:UDP-forming cellulose synthase catalytic subunit [Methylococcales bacterium]
MKNFVKCMETVKEKSGAILSLVILLCLVYLSGLRVDFNTQAYISVLLLTLLISIRPIKSLGFWRVLFVTLSSFIVLRYFSWRMTYTLVYEDFFSYIGLIALFLAEVYGGLMFFLSIFVNIRPIHRTPVPLPSDKSSWPSVDIIIPSYNEPVDLVKITLAAARNVDYPSQKLNIYLLDDGGTAEKLNSPDEKSRESALARSSQLKRLCKQLNVSYITRARNINAKAGNMNSALKHINGDLILVLDADHAPTVDILKKLAGSFIQDEKVFLVQTPHFFINPDPFEKNLKLFHHMPSESDMFYKAIQPGLDFWHASFFCGSAAILRRKAIDEIGGFSGKTITEDSETAIKLHSKGWKSHYILYPLISGLQPETFDSFIIQRMRWAQGMVQNFIFNNPLFLPNLKLAQRICYLSNMMFWFFPFARLVFIISPGLFLFFGLKIYHANIMEFFNYTVPLLAALFLTSHYLFKNVRWAFVSEIYETMQALFSIRAVMAVLINPHKPKFSVTPKMERLDQDLISPLSKPFYWTLGYTVLAACFGLWRYSIYPDERPLIAVTTFWALYNALLLLATLGALHERRQVRANPRVPVNINANWLSKTYIDTDSNQDAFDERRGRRLNPRLPIQVEASLFTESPIVAVEKRIPVIIKDISLGGGSIHSKFELPTQHDGEVIYYIEVQNDKSLDCYQASITNSFKKNDHYIYGVKFLYSDLDGYLKIVRFIHGDSSRWAKIYEDTANDPGLTSSIFFMVKIGVSHGFSHIYVVLTSYFKKLVNIYV